MAFNEAALPSFAIDTTNRAGLYEVPDIQEPTVGDMLVKTEVLQELATLRQDGIDADVIDVKPTYSLPEAVQLEVDRQSEAIGRLDSKEAFSTLFDPTVHSAGAVWAHLSKRAIALWALKQAGNERPHNVAPSIDPVIYDEPLFDGKSAHQVLGTTHPHAAAEIAERYREVTTTPLVDQAADGTLPSSSYLNFIQENDFQFLTSKDFLTGVLDSRAVDTRAIAASYIALDHVLDNPEVFQDRPLITASLACGAAAPMFELNELFAANGVEVGKNLLVDNDPMALASAVALGREYDMSEKVEAHLEDIIGKNLTDYIEPHSVDIVDILGIVDYLPTKIMGYKAATNFIGKIANIMRPGGIIVAGNAMRHRPHQAFFERVWPTLQQRDPAEMVRIIENAGYDRQAIKVRVPQGEGVYGVYGIELPTDRAMSFKEARSQLAAKKILTVASRFNKY